VPFSGLASDGLAAAEQAEQIILRRIGDGIYPLALLYP